MGFFEKKGLFFDMIFHVLGAPQHAKDSFYSRRSRQNSVFGQFLSSCKERGD